jgi:hypothetical protein
MDSEPLDDERNEILPFQPTPWLVQVVHLKQGAHESTAIGRGWLDGQEQRCNLCSICTAIHGHCLIGVPWHVPIESATFFAFRDDVGTEGQDRIAL